MARHPRDSVAPCDEAQQVGCLRGLEGMSAGVGHRHTVTIRKVSAYELAYGQQQSSYMLHWPYPAEFSRF